MITAARIPFVGLLLVLTLVGLCGCGTFGAGPDSDVDVIDDPDADPDRDPGRDSGPGRGDGPGGGGPGGGGRG